MLYNYVEIFVMEVFMPYFSIIIPVYNAEKSLRRCLDSISAQTFQDYEVLIINDGSTDSTPNIAREYYNSDSRITLFSFPNSGVGMARSRGISLSTGEYIIFVDADDTINPELLQRLNLYIVQKTQPPDIIRYQCNLINDEPVKDSSRYNFMSECSDTGISMLKRWSIPGKKYAVYWLFCFNRLCFSETSIPWYRCYEDVAVIPFLVANAKLVSTISYIGYNYTCNVASSLTNVISDDAERSRAYEFFRAYDFAIRKFLELDISNSDKAFLINDYNRRLLAKFNSLPWHLKEEFEPALKARIGI